MKADGWAEFQAGANERGTSASELLRGFIGETVTRWRKEEPRVPVTEIVVAEPVPETRMERAREALVAAEKAPAPQAVSAPEPIDDLDDDWEPA